VDINTYIHVYMQSVNVHVSQLRYFFSIAREIKRVSCWMSGMLRVIAPCMEPTRLHRLMSSKFAQRRHGVRACARAYVHVRYIRLCQQLFGFSVCIASQDLRKICRMIVCLCGQHAHAHLACTQDTLTHLGALQLLFSMRAFLPP
jgi:hypothetical protein